MNDSFWNERVSFYERIERVDSCYQKLPIKLVQFGYSTLNCTHSERKMKCENHPTFMFSCETTINFNYTWSEMCV